jgi:hypothetical protein
MAAEGDFDISCLHGQLICCVVVDFATIGEPIMVALRILQDPKSHWDSLISFRYFQIKVVTIQKIFVIIFISKLYYKK